MNETPESLKALFALDQAPAHDPLFVLEVLRHIEKRRFWSALVEAVPVVMAIGVVAWAMAPMLENLSNEAAIAFVLLTAAVFSAFWVAEAD